MKLPVSLDQEQSTYLEEYLGRKPTSADIKTLIRQALNGFPQDKPHGGKREGAGRKKSKQGA